MAYFFPVFVKYPSPALLKVGFCFCFSSTRLLAQSLLGACGGLQPVVTPHSKIILILLATPLMMRTVLAQEFSCPTLPVLLLFRLSLSVHMGQLQGLGSGAVKCHYWSTAVLWFSNKEFICVVWDTPRLAWEEQASKQSTKLSNIPELTLESDPVCVRTSRQDSRTANNLGPEVSTFRKLPSDRPEDNFISAFYSCLLIRIYQADTQGCNPRTLELETGGLPWVQDQLGS